MSRRIFAAVFLVALNLAFIAPPLAADGQVPIPFVDPYATPLTIDRPGSYVLTRDLLPTGAGPVLEIDCNAMGALQAVQIDFNGFSVDNSANPGDPLLIVSGSPDCQIVLRNGKLFGGLNGVFTSNPLGKLVIDNMQVSRTAAEGLLAPNLETFVIRDSEFLDIASSAISIPGPVDKTGSIANTVIRRTGDHGIDIEGGNGVKIRHNELFDISGVGILLSGHRACLLAENTIRVSNNGISLFTDVFGCKLFNNVIEQCTDAGIFLDLSSGDALLLDNVVSRCGSDGIQIAAAQCRLHRNVANSNGGYGIHLLPAAFDNSFGSNSAIGNAGPLCATSPTDPDFCDDSAGSYSFGDNMFGSSLF